MRPTGRCTSFIEAISASNTRSAVGGSGVKLMIVFNCNLLRNLKFLSVGYAPLVMPVLTWLKRMGGIRLTNFTVSSSDKDSLSKLESSATSIIVFKLLIRKYLTQFWNHFKKREKYCKCQQSKRVLERVIFALHGKGYLCLLKVRPKKRKMGTRKSKKAKRAQNVFAQSFELRRNIIECIVLLRQVSFSYNNLS